MPVYMVYVCHSVSDRAQLERYWASIAPTFSVEWPSMEAADGLVARAAPASTGTPVYLAHVRRMAASDVRADRRSPRFWSPLPLLPVTAHASLEQHERAVACLAEPPLRRCDGVPAQRGGTHALHQRSLNRHEHRRNELRRRVAGCGVGLLGERLGQ